MAKRLRLDPIAYKKLVKEVHKRDHWRCRVPGCGRRNNLHAHHIIFRSAGGDDLEENLVTVCRGCHEALHNRQLFIVEFGNINGKHHVGWTFMNGWQPNRRWI